MQSLKSSTSSSSSELATFKTRIASLESSNRDTLSLLESKSRAYDDLATELSAKHQKTVELRREISTLEQNVRSTNAAASTARLREQNLQAEFEALKRSNEFMDQELKTKNAEHAKFRKDKNAQVHDLQRKNEDTTMAIETLQKNETTLKQRLDEVSQKANDFLNQIQQLRDEAARREESFRSDRDSSARLAELLENSVKTERRRQQELSAELERVKEDAAEEIGRISAEVETEHDGRLVAEQRVAELEVQVERLEADSLLRQNTNTRPGTPNSLRNGISSGTPNGNSSSSRLFFSRSAQPGGGLSGGLNMTQVITDYHNMKADLEAERARNEKLSSTVDEMLKQLDTREPEVAQLREDHDRLEADILEMSSVIDNISKERDQAKKDASTWEGQVNGLMQESELRRGQIRDLSVQMRVLLMELHARNQGEADYTPDERHRLEQLARGHFDEEDVSPTDRFIGQQLTTFKDIAELQDQNTKLLRIAHELGHKLEGEEAQEAKSQALNQQGELESLQQKYERCKDEMRSLVTHSQSYIRERDMFRRMLAHRGQLPAGSDLASMFGESVNGQSGLGTPAQNAIHQSIEQSPSAKDLADYAKLLKEMQAHFDSYRQEAASDRSTLKAQLDSVSKKNTDLRNEVSRKTNEATLTHERYEMLQANYGMLQGQNEELQKRSQTLSERAAAQDLRTQQVAEELIEARSLLESMRNEIANLKAEKEFWKSVEKRLLDDNQNLGMERERLNALNTDLQNLSNEREQSDRDSRRRLQAQVETLEAELQATKRKLNDEVEDGKRMALRREFDNQQSQSRIDDLIASLGTVREELVAAKSTRDHLQVRVDEMTIELRSAEERLTFLRPQRATQLDATDEHPDSDNETREQEYAVQLSELKRDLELARGELTNARSQIEQYKAISQSSEEELRSMNETQDQYRQEMDRVIEEKATRVQELERSVDELHSQIANAQADMSSLQAENAESNRKMEAQKASFDAEITGLKDLNERSESAAHFYQEDLKAQAEIARQAQQNYENELVKHAEAAKNLQKVRGEYNQLRLEIAKLKTEAESARSTLSQSEESWAEAKERYERELNELRSRRDDGQAQNKLLHQQLESVSGQIAALRQKRMSGIEEDDGTTESSVPGNDTMQELVRYLRREKEIVDVQWELSSQEAKRLRQQLEHTQSQLDEARLKLNQQRRAEENNELSALTHNKLMETINELNLNRESNVTLRLEKNQAQTLLSEKLGIIEELQQQIQPLQFKVRELEDAKENQDEELRMTREARERFEQRYLDVLHKSKSIDPAEFDSLKEHVVALENEREALIASKQTLQQQVDGIPDQIKQTTEQANERIQESRQKLIEQSKAKARDQNTKIRERDAALQSATQEKEAFGKQLQEKQKELDEAIMARDEALAAQKSSSANQNQQNGSEDGQVNEGEVTKTDDVNVLALQEKLNSTLSKVNEEVTRSTELQEEVNNLQSRISELQAVVVRFRSVHFLGATTLTHWQNTSQTSVEKANAEVIRLQNERQEEMPTQLSGSISNDEVEQLRQDLIQAQSDAETLRSASVINSSAAAIQTQEGSPSIAEQIGAKVSEIRAELIARHDERVRLAEAQYQKRTDMMRVQLSKRLTDGKAEIRQQAIDGLKVLHEGELEALRARHRDELEELRRNEDSRFEQFKAKWQSEHPETDPGEPGTVKGEPLSKQVVPNSDLTEAEIRRLISTNDHVKSIMRKNIISHGAKEREMLLEEQQKILNEKLAEAEKNKEQAVVMEGKKYNVKVSMTENRARAAQAKIDYVEKAARETPQKPVVEVWEVAKNVKPAPIQSQQFQASAAQLAASTVVNPFAKPPPAEPVPFQSQQLQASAAQPAASAVVNPFARPPPAGPGLAQSIFGKPTSVPNQVDSSSGPSGSEHVQASTTTQSSDPQPTPTNNGDSLSATNGLQAPVAGQSKLPDKALEDQGPQRTNPATGPAAMRNVQQSNLPLPSGGRGIGGMGRGRGRGTGRGQLPQVQTGIPHNGQQSQGSPRGGQLSATARQFVPQAGKRPRDPREEGLEASQHANSSKRVRGGGQGS